MYIKAINGVIEKYPYSTYQLKQDNPQTSFPSVISDELLADWDVFPVVSTPYPEVNYTQDVSEGTPVFVNGQWTQVWVVSDATPEEIAQRTEDKATEVRSERDALLTACDWIVIKATETDVPEIEAWKAYRQALRDVPQQPGFPWNVVWPQPPQ
jgi:hypothetical protein